MTMAFLIKPGYIFAVHNILLMEQTLCVACVGVSCSLAAPVAISLRAQKLGSGKVVTGVVNRPQLGSTNTMITGLPETMLIYFNSTIHCHGVMVTEQK